MKDYFVYNEAGSNEPIRIVDCLGGEKEGGGLVVDPGFDAPETTAVGQYGATNKFAVIKAYRLAADVAAADTTIKIKKGSGIAEGDVLAYGKLAVACTAVDTTNESYDTVTVTMGIIIKAGEVLYQAAAASTNAATPIYTPAYLTKNYVLTGKGDFPVGLFSIGSVRKASANVGKDIAAILSTIKLV